MQEFWIHELPVLLYNDVFYPTKSHVRDGPFNRLRNNNFVIRSRCHSAFPSHEHLIGRHPAIISNLHHMPHVCLCFPPSILSPNPSFFNPLRQVFVVVFLFRSFSPFLNLFALHSGSFLNVSLLSCSASNASRDLHLTTA